MNERDTPALTAVTFGHVLTDDHLSFIARQLAVDVGRTSIQAHPVHFDPDRPFGEQAAEAVDAIEIDWQSHAHVVALPGHSAIAAIILAEIEGRAGSLPTILRFEPGLLPGTWDVVELIDLRRQRQSARTRR